MSPLVSIVVPTFNRERCLPRLVESFSGQTMQDFEVLIVDDGSEDNSENIVHGYSDPRLRFIKHEKNRGAQAARNTGIRFARGTWIAFFDSDDVMLEKSLESRLRLAQRGGFDVVHSECLVLLPGGKKRAFGVPALAGNVYRDLLKSPGPVFPSLLVKKEALEKVGYLDDNIKAFQEWDTVIRLARFYSFGFVADPTFVYDCRREDTISKDLLRDAQGYEQVFRKHIGAMVRHCGIACLATHYKNLAVKYAAAGVGGLARKYRWQCAFLELPVRVRRRLRAAVCRGEQQKGVDNG